MSAYVVSTYKFESQTNFWPTLYVAFAKLCYIVVGGNTLKFCSTQILASLPTKIPAYPTASGWKWQLF